MKKLAYMSEKFTRVLQITDAPKSVKNRMVGRYLSNCGLYIYPSSNVKANLWSSKSFEKAKRYDETLRSIEDMRDYQKMLKRHGYTTNILLVSEHVEAFDIGDDNEFDGDRILFYFTGIDSDGQRTSLSLVSPTMLAYLKKEVKLNLVDKYKVRDDIMIWRHDPKTTWLCRALPDQELLDKINACAEEYGITNVIVGRLYK